MSILIRGMEMPKSCGVCRFAGSCGVHNAEEWPDLESIMFNDVIGIGGVRDPNCPLVPVQAHGRLIDADALEKYFRAYKWDKAADIVCFAPTIIPAEEGE